MAERPQRAQLGSANPNWKGGRTIDPRGYVLIKRPGHPGADVRGYVYEHRLVAETMLGRPILPSEHVHHRDENKTNNDPANLEVLSSAEHRLRHRTRESGRRLPGEPNPTVECRCGCNQTFSRFDVAGRPRTFVSGHNVERPETHKHCECGCGARVAKQTRFKARHAPPTRPPNGLVLCGCDCGESFLRFDISGRARVYVTGHNPHPKGQVSRG